MSHLCSLSLFELACTTKHLQIILPFEKKSHTHSPLYRLWVEKEGLVWYSNKIPALAAREHKASSENQFRVS